jgi:sulfate permease, SulP family
MKPKILTTLPETTWVSLIQDCWAGLTVALIALPLSLAIAIASGAPSATGLFTAVIAGFLISSLGGSRVQIGGPTGAFIVVVASVIAAHGMDGLILAPLMAGLILLVAGFLSDGSLIAHVPEPVVDGFTVGIAIIIATSQLKEALGLSDLTLPTHFIDKLAHLAAAWQAVSWRALLICIASAILTVALRRAFPRWPGLILAVAIMSGYAYAFGPVETIASHYGTLPAGLPMPSFPEITPEKFIALLPAAFTIAFLAGMESLLSAVVADRMIGAQHRPNAELIAQGVANLASPLFGGLPATGAIARTATNVRAGGRTPIAGMFHAVVLLILLLTATGPIGHLALSSLAAILILAAWNMSEPERWRKRLSMPRADLALFVLTMGLTVLADLTIAIAVGTGLGLALQLHRSKAKPTDWQPPQR